MKSAEKAFLDPVHGFILIEEAWLLRLIDGAEFQRLRRIRQLGASFGTYHGAEHTRFGHSLGALHIMRRILTRLEHVHGPLDEDTRIVAQAAALLHDVGHGPLSHCLEYLLTPEGHEHWTRRIVLGDTEVGGILREMDPVLPDRVAAVVAGAGEPPWVQDLVSSQLDVDRMDYLLRDALYTGAEYGRFQLDRIVNTLALHDRRVVVQQKGLHAIEEYVLARHFMYWRVYLHKTIRGMELLLRAAVRRARALAEGGGRTSGGGMTSGGGRASGEGKAAAMVKDGPLGMFFSGVDPDPKQYAQVDDADLFVALKQWARSEDRVLADLSRRFLARDLLKPLFPMPVESVSEEALAAAREIVAREGYDPEYYCLVDEARNVPYDTYAHGAAPEAGTDGSPEDGWGADKQPIVVLHPAGGVAEISRTSPLIAGLARQRTRAVNVYVPEGCRPAVQAAFASWKSHI